MHPVEEYQNYNLDRGSVEWLQLWRLQEEGGVELLYNSVKTGSQLVWRSDPLVTSCGRASQRLWPIERGSICCSSVRSPIPFHTQPFQIKWEVYFSKRLCRSSSLCRCILHAYVLCVCIVGHGHGYTTLSSNSFVCKLVLLLF